MSFAHRKLIRCIVLFIAAIFLIVVDAKEKRNHKDNQDGKKARHKNMDKIQSKCIKYGKRKMYLEAYYCFAYHRKKLESKDSTSKTLLNKYFKNEALALARAGMKNNNIENIKLAISKFNNLIVQNTEEDDTKMQKIQFQIRKLKNFMAASINKAKEDITSTEEPHPLDTNVIDPKSRIPKKHPLTSKFIERVDYNDLKREINNNNNNHHGHNYNNNNILNNFLKERNQPVIITNGPIKHWDVYNNISWEALEMNLPEMIDGIRFTKSRFNLYRTHVPSTEQRNMPVDEFFDLLYDIENKKVNLHRRINLIDEHDEKLIYPYYTGQMPNDIDFENMNLLNVSICKILAGGDDHCGGHPSLKKDNSHKSPTINLWIGASNVTARFHYDHTENTFVQFLGRKHFLLAPPNQTSKFYLYPAGSNYHRQSQIVDAYDMNTIENEFPNFLKVQHLQEGVVFPGELLYIPYYWLHSVTSLDPSFAFSFWSYPPLVQQQIDVSSNVASHLFYSKLEYMLRLRNNDDDGDTNNRFIDDVMVAVKHKFIIDFVIAIHDGDIEKSSMFIKQMFMESKFYHKDSRKQFCDLYYVESKSKDEQMSEKDRLLLNKCPLYTNNISEILLPDVKELIKKHVSIRKDALLMDPFTKLNAFDPAAAASIEILIHALLSENINFDHGDKFSKQVCWYIEQCLYPSLLLRLDDEIKDTHTLQFEINANG